MGCRKFAKVEVLTYVFSCIVPFPEIGSFSWHSNLWMNNRANQLYTRVLLNEQAKFLHCGEAEVRHYRVARDAEPAPRNFYESIQGAEPL